MLSTKKKLKRFSFSSNITFSSQFSRCRQIPLLNFTKHRKATKTGLHSAATKTEIPFSSNITFSSQFSRFCQIPLLNFTIHRKATKTGLHSAATKIETIPIFFEHHIFFTIFSLSSDSITKLHKTSKDNKKRTSISCNKN